MSSQMVNARVTAPRLLLGLMLERFRKAAGISQHQAAQHIAQSTATISKLEAGLGTGSTETLTSLTLLYEVSGDDQETVLKLGSQARGRVTSLPYMDSLPAAFARFADLESFASSIHTYEPIVIPGLLQSPDYIAELLRLKDRTQAEIDTRTLFRHDRQKMFWQSGKEAHFLIHEAAIRSIVGNIDVMKQQISELLAAAYRTSTIQIVPFAAGKNPGRSGSFVIFQFKGTIPDLGYAPMNFGPSTYYDDPRVIEAMHAEFHGISAHALSPDDSKIWLANALAE